MTTQHNHPLARMAVYLTLDEIRFLLRALQDSDWYARQILDGDEYQDAFDQEVARDALKANAALTRLLERLLPAGPA